jgi:hypothetical protein
MYPAKFIPHVVRYALERFAEPGDWVFDPFAGYGSVAVEATLTGRNAELWDLNPVTRIPYNRPPDVEVNGRLYREYRSRVASMGHRKLLELYEAYFRSLAHFLNINSGRVETIALFVGPVKIRGMRIPIDEILKEHLESLGFQHVETIIDRIVSRKLFNSRVNPATGLPRNYTILF